MRQHEDTASFCIRRNRAATYQMKSVGLWSKKLCSKALAWDAHIRRDTAGNLWSTKLLGVRDSSWLRWRRALFPSQASRTATRCVHGHVAQRWEDSVQLARTRTA
eukprot:gnl/MRDRNA2_/MRDRNA2_285138_c0_seq1.p2 gnl/MRDRNA2_/MRDRNA2_285138_c0~~gnl/MRDRNA2_/MRDRNA2_285138_c0_seq1.p2  ORF type:complete len:105 (+),score=10.86 gnl/MRDRNA2_/MRDRNA2_285138_c0_seq1:241-555(+)